MRLRCTRCGERERVELDATKALGETAFSDGVFAVLITVLVLVLRLPQLSVELFLGPKH